MTTRESLEFDVIIVGAGPAGLSAAIKLLQLQPSLSIAIIEKGAEVGAHILSGAVIDPIALNELIPDWQTQHAPLLTPVTHDAFLWLTAKRAFRLPTPPPMKNQGNYIISLGKLCRWLADYAEKLGANIFPGFAATDMLYENNTVIGIQTGDKGIDKNMQKTARYQPGMDLFAKQVILAEGCRGSLTQRLFERFQLRTQCDPQTYGIGFKELWEIPPNQQQLGAVTHTIGWPLTNKTYGGSFIYHLEESLLAIGFVIGLDYQNTFLNPYEEFQRFKLHPQIKPLLTHGKRIAYGARCLNEGGMQAIPELSFPGGLIIGCAAGFLNVPKIKGIHTAMKSGMIAAESIINNTAFMQNIKNSWIWPELWRARNIRPAMNWGLWKGLAYAAMDTYLLRGQAPWTFHYQTADHDKLKLATQCKKITYPAHDQQITFDLMTSVSLTNVSYNENQPCHLKLKNINTPIEINFKLYDSPEQRYCPAGVYEIIFKDHQPTLQINAGNCIQCKACDIKDPTQNIIWTCPEGGDGPKYTMM